MKKSVITCMIEAGTNEIQMVLVPLGAKLDAVKYGDNDGTITVSFESGSNIESEERHLQVWDSRMVIPQQYHPLEWPVSEHGITLYVVEVKPAEDAKP